MPGTTTWDLRVRFQGIFLTELKIQLALAEGGREEWNENTNFLWCHFHQQMQLRETPRGSPSTWATEEGNAGWEDAMGSHPNSSLFLFREEEIVALDHPWLDAENPPGSRLLPLAS